jgi:hypothetical protein
MLFSSAGCGPSKRSFGPSVAWYYSSVGSLNPRIAHSGQQCLGIIRVWAFLSLELLLRASGALVLSECGRSCPSNRSFGPAAPWYYSSAGVTVPRIAPLGQQCLGIIRVWTLVSLESLLRASSALVLFECGHYCPSNRSFGPAMPWYYSSAGVIVPRSALSVFSATHVIFEYGSTSSLKNSRNVMLSTRSGATITC